MNLKLHKCFTPSLSFTITILFFLLSSIAAADIVCPTGWTKYNSNVCHKAVTGGETIVVDPPPINLTFVPFYGGNGSTPTEYFLIGVRESPETIFINGEPMFVSFISVPTDGNSGNDNETNGIDDRCYDGIDNDNDGYTDNNDPGCLI